MKLKLKRLLIVLVPLNIILLMMGCVEDAFMSSADNYGPASELQYMAITGAREHQNVATVPPTFNSGNLTPTFRIVSARKGDEQLSSELMEDVSISNAMLTTWRLDSTYWNREDENGDTLREVSAIDISKLGVISINNGNQFTVGDYYFTVEMITEHDGQEFVSVFEDVFHLNIEPLLPDYLIYQLKNQNLIANDPTSKTVAPLMPSANQDVRYELVNYRDTLEIDAATGVVTLSPKYTYVDVDTLYPVINVVSNISQEQVVFDNSLIVIVSDQPLTMPRETIYFFYPSLKTDGSKPSGGDGYSVQIDILGNGEDIWGEVDNSNAKFFDTPEERPVTNTGRNAIETQMNSGSISTPAASWCVLTTQDLSAFEVGYELSLNYYYQPAFQKYMADGRTPTDMEVYISIDYTGGDIQNANGAFQNGTWTKINDQITCQIGSGKNSGKPSGAPWGTEFIGTPYPGDQSGEDPDGMKVSGQNVYGKWIKCSYDISQYKSVKNFTVAFKTASYFDGELKNDATVPGRSGSYFLSDFNFKAQELEITE